jgi:hypothetical protein
MNHLFSLFFLIAILVTAGCAGVTQNPAVPPTPQIVYVTVYVTGTTASTPAPTLTPTTVPAPANLSGQDPILGIWVGYKYLATGRIQLAWTFMENNTFTLVNTNMKSQHKKYVYGKWKKESAVLYQYQPSSGAWHPFTYDKEKDEFSDDFFQVPFVRVTDPAILVSDLLLSTNLTVTNAYLIHEFNGSRYAGNNYLVTHISIKNFNQTGGYSYTDERIRVVLEDQRGLIAMNQKLQGKLSDPFPDHTIRPGEAQQGTVVFGVPTDSKTYILRLIDSNDYVISNDVELNNVPVYATIPPGPA